MSNSTDPDPSVVSESPDAIHHAGVIILQNVISLVCETFLYGIYVIMVAFAIYVLL